MCVRKIFLVILWQARVDSGENDATVKDDILRLDNGPLPRRVVAGGIDGSVITLVYRQSVGFYSFS